MCGIAGIYGMKDSGRALNLVRKMNDIQAHRGPDAQGEFCAENIALAHRRLSIIDPRSEADQPMTDPSGRYTLIFNGEIYNFEKLRALAGDYPYKSRCDTEVLLAGLIRWGIDFLKQCIGMYAFALWDAEKEELLLVRDPMGIKPLYYGRSDALLVFANEIRTILSTDLFDRRLDRISLPQYLRYQTVHGSDTIIKGIFALPPGSYMKVTDEEMSIRFFYKRSAATERGVRNLPYEETKSLIREKLDVAVQRRLVSDVPEGAFLSGGIDSSAIVALASGHLSKPLKTFTISFTDREFSEAKYAEVIAKKYNTDHEEIRLEPEELIRQLPEAIAAMDHPSGDGINTYVVSGAAKKAGITVALSGLGGDELFAGYPIFRQFATLSENGWLRAFPKALRNAGGFLLEKFRPGIASQKTRSVLNEDYFDLENVYPYSREVSSQRVNDRLLSYVPPAETSVFELVREGVGFETPGFDLPLLSKVTYAEMVTYLESVLLRDTDQMSMAHALEVRVPFLDIELVSAVLSVRDSQKYPHTPKKLLVDAMGDLLPAEITQRSKMGFTFPWEKWMRNELKEFCGDRIAGLKRRDAFNSAELEKRWNAFLKGERDVTWSRIWHLCILEAWMEQNGID